MTFLATLAGLLIIAVAAIVALRMRQTHELALLATKPVERTDTSAIEANVGDLQARVKQLEAAALNAASKKRRA